MFGWPLGSGVIGIDLEVLQTVGVIDAAGDVGIGSYAS